MNDAVDRCWMCGKTSTLQCHHIMNGNPNRQHSEHYGLKVTLCQHCHDRVHNSQDLDVWMKQFAERRFIEKYSMEKWMQVFHKNYL